MGGMGWAGSSYLICQPPWSVHTVVRDKTMLIGHHCPKNCRWLASLVFRELKFLVSPPISWEPEMSAKSFRIHLRSNYNCFEKLPSWTEVLSHLGLLFTSIFLYYVGCLGVSWDPSTDCSWQRTFNFLWVSILIESSGFNNIFFFRSLVNTTSIHECAS